LTKKGGAGDSGGGLLGGSQVAADFSKKEGIAKKGGRNGVWVICRLAGCHELSSPLWSTRYAEEYPRGKFSSIRNWCSIGGSNRTYKIKKSIRGLLKDAFRDSHA